MTDKERLLDCFRIAEENKMGYIVIVTVSPKETRFTVIEPKRYKETAEFYKKHFNNNLKNGRVKIINFCCGDAEPYELVRELMMYEY